MTTGQRVALAVVFVVMLAIWVSFEVTALVAVTIFLSP